MLDIALVRVDDRLIHGQVVVKWLGYLGCKDVLVVDDDLAKDEFMQSVLRLAAPPDVRVRVASVQDAPAKLTGAPAANGHGILLLVRSPQTALALYERGVPFSQLDVGDLAGGPGSMRLFKSVSVTPEQLEALQALRGRGVRVYIQMVPEERPLELSDLVRPGHEHAAATAIGPESAVMLTPHEISAHK